VKESRVWFWLLLLAFATFLSSITYGGEVVQNVYENTVIITDGSGHGSGVLFTRDGRTFVWTAAHVADIFMQPDGSFRDATIRQGEKRAVARVLRAGDYETDTDCALLEIISGDKMEGDARFYRAFDEVKLGQEIIVCGTPLDIEWNERLVSFGRFSAIDRLCDGYPLLKARRLDFVDITAYPGNSGGPVVDAKDGGIVGLLVMGSQPRLLIIEPTRNIYEWARSHDCFWAFDRSVPMPDSIYPWPGDLHVRECREKADSRGSEWGSSPPQEKAARRRGILDIIIEAIFNAA